jgi:hypothetical protein
MREYCTWFDVIENLLDVCRVEVGEGQIANFAFRLQLGHVA